MTTEKLKLSPPWVTYVNKINALFNNDANINIKYDNNNCCVKIYVANDKKATALNMLLPDYMDFGNVELSIIVIPNNNFIDLKDNISMQELFEIVFEGNPVFAFSKEIIGLFNNPITYVVFKNRVVQFFNDNLNDIYGNISTLYQEIASDVFDNRVLQRVCFCTDIEEKVGKPLGEWP